MAYIVRPLSQVLRGVVTLTNLLALADFCQRVYSFRLGWHVRVPNWRRLHLRCHVSPLRK